MPVLKPLCAAAILLFASSVAGAAEPAKAPAAKAAPPAAKTEPAKPAAATSLGKFGDWESFAAGEKAAKYCFAASKPKKSVNASKDRGKAAVTITNWPADKSFGVVGFEAGFPTKNEAPATLEIGPAKFELYTKGSGAWSQDDKAVLAAMLKAKAMVVHLMPAKGAEVQDSFGLEGLAQARAAIDKACGAK